MKFIRLKSVIINPQSIMYILREKNEYLIHMRNTQISGFHIIFGGALESYPYYVRVPLGGPDSDTISKWIDENAVGTSVPAEPNIKYTLGDLNQK